MNSDEAKITFYTLENKEDKLSEKNESKEYDEALKSIIEKDIALLNNNLNRITNEINKIKAIYGIVEIEFSPSLDNLKSIIKQIDDLIKNLIIKNDSIKLGIFSLNKKEKKKDKADLENSINSLQKYQIELISIKDEYNKLTERKESIKETKEEVQKEETMPLERTINFYLEKEKRND